MCGIGAIYFKDRVDLELLDKAIKQTELRGRDAFGIYHFKNGKRVDSIKVVSSFSDYIINNSDEWEKFKEKIEVGSLLIWNCRAHPLPEELRVIQPVYYDGLIIAHNGTINNDKLLLKEEFGYDNPPIHPWVDTYILSLLYRKYKNWTIALSKCEGGIAAIVYDMKRPNELVLIKNFKPLCWSYKDGILLVLSEIDTLPNVFGDRKSVYQHYNIEWIQPYTMLTINLESGDLRVEEIQTRHAAHRYALPEPSEDIAVVMCSGGLDSSTAAFVACKLHKRKKVYLVNFNYGQRSADREWEAVQKLANQLRSEGYNVEAVRFDATWLGKLGKSPLTDRSIELPKEVDSVESTKCWVPARNLVFLSYLAAFCEAIGAKYIYTGINLEESGCLPNVRENTILMADGTKKLPAEVKVGDKLLAWDEKNNRIVVTEVKQVFKRVFPYVYKIHLRECGPKKRKKVIYASPEHPFYVKGVGWIRTDQLKPGDILFTFREAWGIQQFTGENNPWYGKSRSGPLNPMYGKKRQHTEETKRKIGQTIKRLWEEDPTYREKVLEGVRRAVQRPEHKQRITEIVRKIVRKRLEELKEQGYEHWNQLPEIRQKISESIKKLIEEGKINPATNLPKPTKLELKFMDFLRKYNLTNFKYVGDGQIWITSNGRHLNPDFIDTERRIVIEVAGSFWHTPEEMEERRKLYEDVGWKMILVWDYELEKDERGVLEKILSEMYVLTNGWEVVRLEKVTEIREANRVLCPVCKRMVDILGLPHHLDKMHSKSIRDYPELYELFKKEQSRSKFCKDGIVTYNFYCEPYNNFFVGEILTHNSYPDNDIEAYKMANLLLDYYTLGRVKLVLVLERLMKYEIVTLGYHLGLDYSYTWSCDEGFEKPCGVCGCCWTRQHALRKAGIPDKQEYLNKPSNPAPWLNKEIVKKPDINKILETLKI